MDSSAGLAGLRYHLEYMNVSLESQKVSEEENACFGPPRPFGTCCIPH